MRNRLYGLLFVAWLGSTFLNRLTTLMVYLDILTFYTCICIYMYIWIWIYIYIYIYVYIIWKRIRRDFYQEMFLHLKTRSEEGRDVTCYGLSNFAMLYFVSPVFNLSYIVFRCVALLWFISLELFPLCCFALLCIAIWSRTSHMLRCCAVHCLRLNV